MSNEREEINSSLRAALDVPDARELVEETLSRLHESGGPRGVSLDEAGVVTFEDETERPITLSVQDGFAGFVLSAPVCSTEGLSTDVLKRVLKANASWELTAGGIFGMTGSDTSLIYCRRVLLSEPDPTKAMGAIRSFCKFVTEWQQGIELAGDLPLGQQATAQDRPPPPNMIPV